MFIGPLVFQATNLRWYGRFVIVDGLLLNFHPNRRVTSFNPPLTL